MVMRFTSDPAHTCTSFRLNLAFRRDLLVVDTLALNVPFWVLFTFALRPLTLVSCVSKVYGSSKSAFVAVCIFAPESRTANTVLRICALLFLAVAPNDKYVTLPGDMRAGEKSLSSLDVSDISSEL